MATALSQMDAHEFSERPSAGQRSLIITKVVDLFEKKDERYEYPLVSLLELLIRLGTRLAVAEYQEIVDMALPMAFDHEYADHEKGKVGLRRVLAEVAPTVGTGIHAMMSKTVISYFRDHDFAEYSRWQRNGVRELVSSLLANKSCEKMAPPLTKIRRRVDKQERIASAAEPWTP